MHDYRQDPSTLSSLLYVHCTNLQMVLNVLVVVNNLQLANHVCMVLCEFVIIVTIVFKQQISWPQGQELEQMMEGF